MRLLSIHNLEFQTFPADNRPPYIAISHRWSDDEASYKDVLKKRNTNGFGYWKIVNLCAFVRDWAPAGVGHIWIDTCCIDQKSSTELSESINSMWKWYTDCAFCIAYLRDVTSSGDCAATTFQFRRSEWFDRGWTLQELLAPKCVIFLNQRFEVIGRKSDPSLNIALAPKLLNGVITEITGIESSVLSGSYQWRRRVLREVKMSWAANRQTTKPEDSAYCMLGIFDVYMNMLYGEGERNARKRLEHEIERKSQELEDDEEEEWLSNIRILDKYTGPLQRNEKCGVCGLLLVKPLTTICSHSFCETCLDIHDLVTITALPISGGGKACGDASSWNFQHFARCPCCDLKGSRTTEGTPFARPNEVLSREVQHRRPTLHARRLQDLSRKGHGDQMMSIIVGNWHTDDGSDRHLWTFFVKPNKTEVIGQIQYRLDQDSLERIRIQNKPPFALHGLGWGYFNIEVSIFLKRGFSWLSPKAEDGPAGEKHAMIKLNWTLDFESFGGQGAMGRCFARFSRKTKTAVAHATSDRDTRHARSGIRVLDSPTSLDLFVRPDLSAFQDAEGSTHVHQVTGSKVSVGRAPQAADIWNRIAPENSDYANTQFDLPSSALSDLPH